jgi:hypothetical protein
LIRSELNNGPHGTQTVTYNYDVKFHFPQIETLLLNFRKYTLVHHPTLDIIGRHHTIVVRMYCFIFKQNS